MVKFFGFLLAQAVDGSGSRHCARVLSREGMAERIWWCPRKRR